MPRISAASSDEVCATSACSGRATGRIGCWPSSDVAPTDADLAALHAPAGLDLGADGAEEVATAIVAEILATLRGRTGVPLRDRPGPIHG